MNIGIIGGGASGMILASLLKSDNENKITLLEKNNKLGKKLLLTGNGKCNFTSGDFNDLDDIYNNEFARSVYKKYDNSSFLEYMKAIGIVPKLEVHKGLKYYYPNSNKATSVYYNILDKINENKIDVRLNENVIDIKIDDGKFVIRTNTNSYIFDKVIVSTGGITYKKTGSDGEIFKLLKALGHKIIKTLPALSGFKINDSDLKNIINVRVDAKVKIECDGKAFEEHGEIQWTNYGISGIPIMNLSRKVNRLIAEGKRVTLIVNFYESNNLVELLEERKKNLHYKEVKDFLCGFLPDEINSVIIKRSNIICKKVCDLTSNDLKTISDNITNFTIRDIELQESDNAQITIGGISTDDVSIDTLESKIINRLYFTGEVLDIDGKCGGYNLQLAYSTARIVAESILTN